MSGPPYPRVIPLTQPPTFDWWQTVISQYANSPVLTKILENFYECVDLQANFDAFFNLIWNVQTAVGYGLDVWGRIVGVSRVIPVQSTDFFGFTDGTVESGLPFNQAPFFNGVGTTSNYPLTDDAFRLLIYAKALTNISDGSIKSVNQILLTLFPARGNCYVVDGLDMTLTYTFDFVLTPVELGIVSLPGILPKSVGVEASISSL